ncbi:hypothetical protein HSR122_0826 [Halapricum desulfuricans]|uniref:N-sulphoglucosamine sulphohydrolase C-terminal domain-containing protein n=1 Tax=Halapricum desulfuricans TaxID=2841257 RepID=A0A897N1I1_9EURY|nr:hypothetical protein HSR122_0826 [Halapricum desulfuricans]
MRSQVAKDEWQLKTNGCHVIHGGEEELYDLQNDPDETNNLIEDEPKIANRLRAKLAEWRVSHRTDHAERRESDTIENPQLEQRLNDLGYL